jgi:hypothetical protein
MADEREADLTDFPKLSGGRAPKPKQGIRWFYFTPGRLIFLLLTAEGILLALDWFRAIPKGFAVLIANAGVAATMLLMLFWFLFALLFRWRFQFSLRSLLALTIIVAVACSWLAVEMKRAREQRTAVEALAELDARVFYDYEMDGEGKWIRYAEPTVPMCLRKMLGDNFFFEGVSVYLHVVDENQLKPLSNLNRMRELLLSGPGVTNDGLEYLERMSQLKELTIGEPQITDLGLEHLQGLKQLEELDLNSASITNDGLKRLKGLKQLNSLWLGETLITDSGLRCLKESKQLQILWLCRTQITDAGLVHLAEMHQLKYLNVNRTAVTDAGVGQLQKALPNADISSGKRKDAPEEKHIR